MHRRAALPPARIIIVRSDLAEAELLFVIGADPLRRVDRAFLKCGVYVAAGDLLGHRPKLLEHLPRDSADPHLEAAQVSGTLYFLAEPAAHLRAGVAAREADDVEFLEEFVEQLGSAALVE